ncbi:MAG: toll/interleukin-1 receptor domain-containing protein, partial [Pedobacter sp.]
MKAFISYTHADSAILDKLHTHLAQLKREGLLKSWTDREIKAGGLLNQQIEANLLESNLFLALLSPEYIASNYCYEIEFEKAIELNKQNKLII